MKETGRYLYSVVRTRDEVQLGAIGIGESPVYTVPFQDIAAVVHSCQPVPYDTKDKKMAEEWILEHNYVIDHATKRFGTVLPFSFDAMVRGDDEAIKGWLAENYEMLSTELHRVEEKDEYSVQIFYDDQKLKSRLLESDQDLKALKEKTAGMSPGKAYLLNRNLEIKLKDGLAIELSRLGVQFGQMVQGLADEIKADERKTWVPDKYKDKKMLASFSCLVHHDKVECLGKALDEINNMDGFAVRFTGPWAPFSFTDLGRS
ncbi:MAG TPA: GvpL/GvpF family gas vesicle protein [Methanotrichaceae archaeon]|nr:GvpL/GvpF family gas vesicle protein [Methanotrichaceae archaeon]